MFCDDEYHIRQIDYSDTKPFLLNVHYARRMPTICYAFGLFKGMQLIGVCTYGIPASPSLCIGIGGGLTNIEFWNLIGLLYCLNLAVRTTLQAS
mgnify:CR=1 FL=1